jgi:fumarylpyruvate hydrolase
MLIHSLALDITMHAFVVDPPERITVPVHGGGLFPVRRIFCVGRNYAAHAREMGGDPTREPPFFFTKPADALVVGGRDTPYPTLTNNLHHEVELVVAISQGGSHITLPEALDHVYGYAVGIDLTRRDMQDDAKQMRRPWDMTKGFDHSAPIGNIVPAAAIGHPSEGVIRLCVNGNVRQLGNLSQMIWPIQDVIVALSELVALAPGDLIFTGTPEGVGALQSGDTLAGYIEGIGHIYTRIV